MKLKYNEGQGLDSDSNAPVLQAWGPMIIYAIYVS